MRVWFRHEKGGGEYYKGVLDPPLSQDGEGWFRVHYDEAEDDEELFIVIAPDGSATAYRDDGDQMRVADEHHSNGTEEVLLEAGKLAEARDASFGRPRDPNFPPLLSRRLIFLVYLTSSHRTSRRCRHATAARLPRVPRAARAAHVRRAHRRGLPRSRRERRWRGRGGGRGGGARGGRRGHG